MINYKEAKKLWAITDLHTLASYKEELKQYYTSGSYEKDIIEICKNAYTYFESINVQEDSLIIFDVDDTAIYKWHPDGDFIWNSPQFINEYQQHIRAAIKPVLNLYNFLLEKNFKLIFLTSRIETLKVFTQNELLKAGYTKYNDIILMPSDIYSEADLPIALWKLTVRQKLAEKYNIVGCVADRNIDFEGGYTGSIIKLPNYVY